MEFYKSPIKLHQMTKSELLQAIAAATETSKKTAGLFLDAIVAIAYKEAKKTGEFVIPRAFVSFLSLGFVGIFLSGCVYTGKDYRINNSYQKKRSMSKAEAVNIFKTWFSSTAGNDFAIYTLKTADEQGVSYFSYHSGDSEQVIDRRHDTIAGTCVELVRVTHNPPISIEWRFEFCDVSKIEMNVWYTHPLKHGTRVGKPPRCFYRIDLTMAKAGKVYDHISFAARNYVADADEDCVAIGVGLPGSNCIENQRVSDIISALLVLCPSIH